MWTAMSRYHWAELFQGVMGNVGEGSQLIAQTLLTTPLLQQKEWRQEVGRGRLLQSWRARTNTKYGLRINGTLIKRQRRLSGSLHMQVGKGGLFSIPSSEIPNCGIDHAIWGTRRSREPILALLVSPRCLCPWWRCHSLTLMLRLDSSHINESDDHICREEAGVWICDRTLPRTSPVSWGMGIILSTLHPAARWL